jgi:hypothetical protein
MRGATDVFRNERVITRLRCMNVSHNEHVSTICRTYLSGLTERMMELPVHTFDCKGFSSTSVTTDSGIFYS